MGYIKLEDNGEEVIFVYSSFWKKVFSNFYFAYSKVIIVGSLILAICLVSLYVQAKYPYQYKQKDTVQEEEVKEDVQPATQTEAPENDAVLSGHDFKNKYKNYKIKYKGKKGVGKKKAEQILEKYLYYEWDSGIVIMPKTIRMPTFADSSSSLYRVIHVRKINNNKIVAYLKFASDNNKSSIKKFTVKEKNGTYWMNYGG